MRDAEIETLFKNICNEVSTFLCNGIFENRFAVIFSLSLFTLEFSVRCQGFRELHILIKSIICWSGLVKVDCLSEWVKNQSLSHLTKFIS